MGKLLLFLYGGLGVWLAGAGERPYPMKDLESLDQQNLLTCGIRCNYEKGNENLSVDGYNTHQKLLSLDRVYEDYRKALATAVQDPAAQADANQNESTLIDNMAGFCVDKEAGSTCYRRYVCNQAARLREIRDSTLKNGQAAANLTSKQDAVTYSVDEKSTPPPPLLPVLPGLADLKTENEARVKLLQKQNVLSSIDYEKWLEGFPKPPDRSAFVKIDRVDRNPGHPAEGKLEIPRVDSDGKPEIDEKAYRAAMTAYSQKLQLSQQQKAALLGQYGPGNAGKLRFIQSTERPLSVDAYVATRKTFAEAYNGKQTSSQDKDRVLAATTPGGKGVVKEVPLRPGSANSNTVLKWDIDAMTRAVEKWEKRCGDL